MSEQTDHPTSSADAPDASESKLRRFARTVVQNPYRSAQVLFFSIIAIIVLQNLETTSIDVLFWKVTSLPKLVVIFLSMLIGAAAWEIIRRLRS